MRLYSPQVALSTSGDQIIATVKRGTYDIAGYTLYVNGVEQSGISLGGNGVVGGYTLKGTETSIKFTVSDSSGYVAGSEITLTPASQKTTVDDKTKKQ